MLFSLVILGMWSASFYLGNFVGPTLAGILVESWGFRKSSLLFWCLYLIITVVDVAELVSKIRGDRGRVGQYQRLD